MGVLTQLDAEQRRLLDKLEDELATGYPLPWDGLLYEGKREWPRHIRKLTPEELLRIADDAAAERRKERSGLS